MWSEAAGGDSMEQGMSDLPTNPRGKAHHIFAVVAAVSLALMSGALGQGPKAAPRINPILGRWTLIDADMIDVCKAHREFAPVTDAQARGGPHPIYNVQATYVDVSYGGPNFEEWDINGPNDLTLRLGGPYVTSKSSCRYHRS